MNQETHNTPKGALIRVPKNEARKAYDKGQEIWVVPAHVRFSFENQWIRPCCLVKGNTDFNTRIEHYEYYNCVESLGTYTKFYVRSGFTETELKTYAASMGLGLRRGSFEGQVIRIDLFNPVSNNTVETYEIDKVGLWHLQTGKTKGNIAGYVGDIPIVKGGTEENGD